MARKQSTFRFIIIQTFIVLLILALVTITIIYGITRDLGIPGRYKGRPFQSSITNLKTDTEKHHVRHMYQQYLIHKAQIVDKKKNLDEAHSEEKMAMMQKFSESNDKILKAEYNTALDDGIDEVVACSPKTPWYRLLLNPSVPTDFSSWDFREEAECHYEDLLSMSENTTKLTLKIQCANDDIGFNRSCVRLYKMNETITIPSGDPFLLKFIESCCYDSLRVPNVVHYVRYNRSELKFEELVSFISVIRFVRPCAILIHGDNLPTGKYWNYIRAVFPNIIHVKRELSKTIFGKRVGHKEHSGDLMRLEILLEYGGIFLDTDSVFLKPVDKFRSYPCTLASQLNIYLLCGFIFAEKNARFIQKWIDGYRMDYRNDSYAYNCMAYPKKLLFNYSSYVHIERGTLSRVNKNEFGNAIYKRNHVWKDKYALHLNKRIYTAELDEHIVKTYNSTIGSICRHVLYGNKGLCHP